METRSRYQQEMDQVKLSEEKANETLKLMLEKNKELREKEIRKAKKSSSAVWARRVLPVFAAAAACIALVFFVLRQPGNQVTFGSLRLSQLPVTGVSRGENPEKADFETAFVCKEGSLFPGWEIVDSETVQYTTSDGPEYEAHLTIRKQEKELSVTINTRTEPALYTALADKESGLKGIRLNLDPETNTRTAISLCNDLYISLSSDTLSEKDFLDAVKAITQSWDTEKH